MSIPDPPKVVVELQAPLEEQLPTGSLVGDYQIEKVIGIGGMGVVYGAQHQLIGKRAAIKVLNARYCADRVAVERFVQEAQSVNRVGHPNIVDIFSFGRLPDGRSYLVMEWLDGETLDARITRLGQLPIEEALAILIPLTRALEAAHAADVIHRDLKPDNVLLMTDDDGLRVKLLDFGIAKLSTTSMVASRTASGMTIGTPLFMSPEQARGVGVAAASDVYSLGVLAYTMVCGKTPFGGEGSSVEILNAHIKNPPPPPGALRPDIPALFETLILDLLTKDPEARPAVADVRVRLKRIAYMVATGSDAEPPEASLASFRTGTVRRAQTGPPMRAPSEEPVAYETETLRPAPRRWIVPAAAVIVACLVATIVGVRAQGGATEASPPPPVPAVVVAPAVVPQPPPVVAPTAPTPGWIELAIRPETATVSIDGEPVVLANGRARVDLAAGEHAVAIVAAGHVPVSKTIAVTAARGSEVALRLERAKVKPPRTRRLDPDGVVDPYARRPK